MQMTDLLEISIKKMASDLHVLPELTPFLRIDGELLPIQEAGLLSQMGDVFFLYQHTTLTHPHSFLPGLWVRTPHL